MAARCTKTQAFSLFAFQDIITSVTGIIVLVMLLLTLELVQIQKSSATQNSSSTEESLRKAIEEIQQEINSVKQVLDQGDAEIQQIAALPLDEAQRQEDVILREINQLAGEVDHARQRYQESALQTEVLQGAALSSSNTQAELESMEQRIELLNKKLAALESNNRVVYNPNAKSHKKAWLVDIALNHIQVAELGQVEPPTKFDQSNQQSRMKTFQAWSNSRMPSTEYFILLVRPETIEMYKEIRGKLEQQGFDLGFDVIGSDVTAIDPVSGAGLLQ